MSVRHARFAAFALSLCWFAALRSAAFAEEAGRTRTDASGDPLPTGALARLGTTRFRSGDYILDCSLSPDGKSLAVSDGNNISLMDARAGKELHRYQAKPDGARRVTFSPDGKSLLAVSDGGHLILYEAKTGTTRGKIENLDGVEWPGPVFSADGKRVAVGCNHYQEKRSPKVWDLNTRKLISSFPLLTDDEVKVALSADGKVLASWESARVDVDDPKKAGTIRLWDVESGKELRRVESGKFVISAAFSPDGKHLAMTATFPPALYVWDVGTGRRVRQIAMKTHDGGVLRYSPDGKRLAAATTNGDVWVWEAASGKQLRFHHEPRCCFNSIIFRDGEAVAAGTVERSLFLWGGREGRTFTPRNGHTGDVLGIGFGRDSDRVTTIGPDGVRHWKTKNGELLRHIIVSAGGEEDGLYQDSCRLSPRGKYLAVRGGRSELVRLADAATGKVLHEWKQSTPTNTFPAAFSAKETVLALLGRIGEESDYMLRLWEPRSGRLLRIMKAPPADRYNVALSPDGRTVAVMAVSFAKDKQPRTCQVYVWNVSSGAEMCRFTSDDDVDSLAFAPDSDLLATDEGRDGTILLRNRINGKRLYALKDDKNEFLCPVMLSPDGRTLATVSHLVNSSSWKSRVLVWELASGAVRTEFDGHQGVVRELAFSPDCRILATGGDDTTVLLWDVTGRSSAAALAKEKPSARELDVLWSDLDSRDARKAHQAMIRLTAAPAEAVALFHKNLTPAAPSLTAKEQEQLIADLDSDSFAARENASRRLALAGEEAQSALTAALKTKPGLEKRRRLEALLEIVGSGRPAWELVRPLRGVEVLERLATPEARQLLETLSQGATESRLTRDAKSALRRLSQKP